MSVVSGGERIRAAIEPLRADPARTAILSDLDGTLAPIVARPEQTAIPDRARGALAALAERYGLVGIVSGRRALDARRIVGIDGLAYAGNHGFELLEPGAAEPNPEPELEGHEDDARAFVAELDRGELDELEIRVEDKGAIMALHWRGAADEAAAEWRAGELAAEIERRGLTPHRGRMVLEVRPGIPVDKGRAVARLLEGDGLRAAMYGGDDRTDLDAFRGLRQLGEEGALAAVLCVGVLSAEAPEGLGEASDLAVAGTEGYVELLETLAA